MPLSNLTPQYQTTYLPAGGAAPTNQMLGNGYDASGNQRTLDPFTLTYDAENRVVSAAAPSPVSVTESYAYDGEGRRVQKTGTTSTVFVYDGFGNLAAEYGQAGSASGTQYLTTDHLGSTRLVTDANGNVVARYDYLPFGEGIAAGLGGRSSFYSIGAFPVSADGLSVKFTGKERDAETGLDYFGARYFSSAQGRWTGPDWSATPQAVPYGDLKDPQTLNLYVYVRNSPLSKADPDGHCGIIGDYPCSLGEFIASVPDRAVGGLKGLSNLLLRTHLEPSNDEQADAMETTRRDGPTIVGYGAMVLPGPKGLKEVPVEPYEVGTFSDLKSRSSVGDQLDIHHVGQQNPMRQTVSDYDPNTAPSIALPEAEHQAIPRQRGAVKLSPRDQLAKDARDLRSVGVPNKQIQKVIELNKQKYPEMKK
jgi:RHS repeat-associated protein